MATIRRGPPYHHHQSTTTVIHTSPPSSFSLLPTNKANTFLTEIALESQGVKRGEASEE